MRKPREKFGVRREWRFTMHGKFIARRSIISIGKDNKNRRNHLRNQVRNLRWASAIWELTYALRSNRSNFFRVVRSLNDNPVFHPSLHSFTLSAFRQNTTTVCMIFCVAVILNCMVVCRINCPLVSSLTWVLRSSFSRRQTSHLPENSKKKISSTHFVVR